MEKLQFEFKASDLKKIKTDKLGITGCRKKYAILSKVGFENIVTFIE